MEQAVSSVRTAPIDPLLGAAPAEVHREPFTTPALGFRPEIEGLRAIAVVLVVLYHADLGPFSGGFIGVDVFFVVSGFLITSLLLGEVARTGTIALPMFWARRARRLLPASSLVIVATLLVAQWWYDPLLLASLERDALAAAAFIVNYVFAFREAHGDGGYFRSTRRRRVQHVVDDERRCGGAVALEAGQRARVVPPLRRRVATMTRLDAGSSRRARRAQNIGRATYGARPEQERGDRKPETRERR